MLGGVGRGARGGTLHNSVGELLGSDVGLPALTATNKLLKISVPSCFVLFFLFTVIKAVYRENIQNNIILRWKQKANCQAHVDLIK